MVVVHVWHDYSAINELSSKRGAMQFALKRLRFQDFEFVPVLLENPVVALFTESDEAGTICLINANDKTNTGGGPVRHHTATRLIDYHNNL